MDGGYGSHDTYEDEKLLALCRMSASGRHGERNHIMIIFGTRGYLYQLAVLTMVCGWCGNPAAHTLRKRVTKFTLFFVPLFPFSTKYATQCTFCGGERQIPKEQADGLLAQAQGARTAIRTAPHRSSSPATRLPAARTRTRTEPPRERLRRSATKLT